jgi:hypothetical protein
VNTVLAALFAEVVLITYRAASKDTTKNNPLPPFPVPAAYVGAFTVFGVLAALPGRARVPAGVFAWGLVVATGLNFYTSTGAPAFAQAPLTIIAPDTVPS